jgi:hypothetical protein
MIVCTIFQGWHDYPLYGRLYCYNNVWADTLLRGGNAENGPWAYFDPFTWEGFGEFWFFELMFGFLKTFIKNTIYGSIFIVWYLANSDMVWCFPGEKIMIGTFNGCTFFGDTY